MPYATEDDLLQAIGEHALIDIAGVSGSVDSDKVAAALTEAQALADTYLSDYLPLSTTQVATVKWVVVQLANERLRLGEQSTEDSRRGYDRAMLFLRDIAGGKAQLPGVEPSPLVQAGDPAFVAVEPFWSRDNVRRLF